MQYRSMDHSGTILILSQQNWCICCSDLSTHRSLPLLLVETAAPRKLSRPILPVLPSSHSPGASSSSSNRRSSGRNQGVHELSACEQLTVELVRHEDSWPFMKLVSRTQVLHPCSCVLVLCLDQQEVDENKAEMFLSPFTSELNLVILVTVRYLPQTQLGRKSRRVRFRNMNYGSGWRFNSEDVVDHSTVHPLFCEGNGCSNMQVCFDSTFGIIVMLGNGAVAI